MRPVFYIIFILGFAACTSNQILPDQPPLLTVEVIRPTFTATTSPLPTTTFTAQPTATIALLASNSPAATPTPSSTFTSQLTSLPPPTVTPSPTATPISFPVTQTIGYSIENRPLISYQFSQGSTPLIFVGGIHGGYEWNTILLAYEAIDYFSANLHLIPDSVALFIIPSANPDGQYHIVGDDGRFSPDSVIEDTFPGRFNSHQVDLNRNWDCQWSATAVWRNQPVNGGTQPFSEPENVALRDFFLEQQPAFVLFWHSAANGVFAAGCPETYRPSMDLVTIYGEASGYPTYERFAFYPVTGDAGDWLATQEIPSISIELKTHSETDWPENLAGMLAIFEYYK